MTGDNKMKAIIFGALLAALAINASASESAILEAKNPQNKTAWHIVKNESGKSVLTNDITAVNAYEVRRTTANQAALDDLRENQRKLASKPSAAIGMSKSQVRNKTNWGEPKYINTTTNRYGTHEQWVYDDYQYLYFDNGKLTTIQQ